MDPNTPGSLEEQIAELRSRVQLLEQALKSQGILLQRENTEPPPVHPLADATLPPAPPPAALPPQRITVPRFGSPALAPHKNNGSLESRIGSQWLNRIGILAVLIGMAWFLKFAIDNHWIGPLGRVLIGLTAGAGLGGWAEPFLRPGSGAFSSSLKAVGSGTLYLSLWAAFSLYQFIPSSVAFAAMIAVTGFNGYMAWLQDAE